LCTSSLASLSAVGWPPDPRSGQRAPAPMPPARVLERRPRGAGRIDRCVHARRAPRGTARVSYIPDTGAAQRSMAASTNPTRSTHGRLGAAAKYPQPRCTPVPIWSRPHSALRRYPCHRPGWCGWADQPVSKRAHPSSRSPPRHRRSPSRLLWTIPLCIGPPCRARSACGHPARGTH
jgi:hypothetical protein